MDYSEVLAILAFFGSFWVAVTTISLAVIIVRYYRLRGVKQLGFDLAMEALHHQASVAEVERLLLAYNGDRRLAKLVADSYLPRKKHLS